MERTLLVAIGCGAFLAVSLFLIKGRSMASDSVDQAIEIAAPDENTNDTPLPSDEEATHDPTGWVTVHQPKADWNLSDSDLIVFICPRPDWYPYHTFRGPPIPESTAGIDPAGYVLRTAQGVRLHRDGWVVTSDGRAYRADAVDD